MRRSLQLIVMLTKTILSRSLHKAIMDYHHFSTSLFQAICTKGAFLIMRMRLTHYLDAKFSVDRPFIPSVNGRFFKEAGSIDCIH